MRDSGTWTGPAEEILRQAARFAVGQACAWVVTIPLSWDGFFFQRLLFSLTIDDGHMIAIARAVGFLAGGCVAAASVDCPVRRSLPHVVFAAAVGFALAALVMAGGIAYGLAMTTNLALPEAWDGFLWM